MRARALPALLLFAACQTGESTPAPRRLPARPPVAARPVIAPPAASGVTPMQMVANDAPPPTTAAASPFSLTASDGSGLQLTRLEAKAVVQGPLAFTELHLYFKNPEARTREGTFTITLPAGAAVSRFAMENDGAWQEAEVVEKQVARRIYDDYLHRKQDPALLEKAAGNQFSAKVFPIAASAEKHLIVSFSQELAGRSYTLPLRGLPTTARVVVQLTARGSDGAEQVQTLEDSRWQPGTDFVASVTAPAAAVASGELLVSTFSLAPRAALGGSSPGELTLLVDTSASRALGFARYARSLEDLVLALRKRYGDALALQVIAYDQDTEAIYDGPVAGYGDAQTRALLARGAAGASDLGFALAHVGPTKRRVVLVTDGVVTAGVDTPALVDATKKLTAERIDVVLTGGIRDERLAASIARAGLPQAGDVYDLDRGVDGVAAGLGETVMTDVTIDIPGATWVYPRRIPAARPGTPLIVYARLPRPAQTVDLTVGGASVTLHPGAATPALVERAIASAEIEELENQLATLTDDKAAAKIRDEIGKRSVRARVVSSQTSMLVLESDSDYDRYKIPRTALADILVIGPHGLEQQRRTDAILAAQTRKKQDSIQLARQEAIEQARNAGVLGAAALDGSFASVTSPTDIASGFDDSNVYGGLLGDESGDMQGAAGYGRSGNGPGGGGTGWGTIGTGRYGTIGHGAGTGTGYGVGGGRGGMRGRSATVPRASLGQPTTAGDLDRALIRRYIKRNIQKITYCYEKELLLKPSLEGTVATRFVITPAGTTTAVSASGVDPAVSGCIAEVLRTIEFPHPASGSVQVAYPITLGMQAADPEPFYDAPSYSAEEPDSREQLAPLTGKLADVMRALQVGNKTKAYDLATAWHDSEPGDVLALIAVGEALEARGDRARAARIYGSIIDLFPTRADMRRFAGERMSRLGQGPLDLVIDTYRRAVADRPDHVTGHRLLAYALVRKGDFAGAFAAILAGVDHPYPPDRFAGADRVLAEDAGMIAAAYIAHGGAAASVMKQLDERDIPLITKPSTRFIMYWETDSNDVDFHIRDARGGHAWYSEKQLASGGELYADITTGYGPECFAIEGTPAAGPYRLSINYYSQGPMGYGMGLLQIQRFDGKNFRLQDRPYVVMTDGAFVELGSYQ